MGEQPAKRNKLQMNTGDNRHAFVKWPIAKDKYNILPMSDFIAIPEGDEYEGDLEYKVVFNKQKYSALLLFIETLDECERHEISISHHIQDSTFI